MAKKTTTSGIFIERDPIAQEIQDMKTEPYGTKVAKSIRGRPVKGIKKLPTTPISFRVSTKLKSDAVQKHGEELPGKFATWLTLITYTDKTE